MCKKQWVWMVACLITLYGKAQVTDTVIADTTTTEVYIEDVEEDVSTEEDEETVTIPQYIPRVVSDDSLKAWQQEKGYAYMAYIDSVLRARQLALQQQPPPLEDTSPGFSIGPLLRILFWIVGIGALAFLLIRLFAGNTRLFWTNRKMADSATVPEHEEAQQLGYSVLAQRAAREGNYRSATRYQFLETLNALAEAGHLQLAAQKTNMQYLAELQGKPFANQLARLALLYDYVWYGSFSVTQHQYTQILQEHESLRSQIHA